MFYLIMGVIIFIGLLYMAHLFDKDEDKQREADLAILKDTLNVSKIISLNLHPRQDIIIDTQNKKVAYYSPKNPSTIYIDFEDILSCEIMCNNQIVSGGMGGAVIGGIVGGSTGAIIGGNKIKGKATVSIRIIGKDISNPLIMIPVFENCNVESTRYEDGMDFANNVYASIMAIISRNK